MGELTLNIGDIVYFKNDVSVTKTFFLISEIDEDGLCKIVGIYPITASDEEYTALPEGLKLFARANSKDHSEVLIFIVAERRRRNMDISSQLLKYINEDSDNSNNQNLNQTKDINPINKQRKFDSREFIKSFKSIKPERTMESHVMDMNRNLDLLSEAIKNGNKDDIEFLKEELEKIRRVLMELEYFPLVRKRWFYEIWKYT